MSLGLRVFQEVDDVMHIFKFDENDKELLWKKNDVILGKEAKNAK